MKPLKELKEAAWSCHRSGRDMDPLKVKEWVEQIEVMLPCPPSGDNVEEFLKETGYDKTGFWTKDSVVSALYQFEKKLNELSQKP